MLIWPSARRRLPHKRPISRARSNHERRLRSIGIEEPNESVDHSSISEFLNPDGIIMAVNKHVLSERKDYANLKIATSFVPAVIEIQVFLGILDQGS